MIVLDTSVIIDLFIDGDAADATDAIIKRGEGALSAITVFELLSGVRDPAHLRERRELIDTCRVLEVSREVSFRAAELYTDLRDAGQLIPNEDSADRRHRTRAPVYAPHPQSQALSENPIASAP